MSDLGDMVRELNESAHNWDLNVLLRRRPAGDEVRFVVSGQVYPFKADGTRVRRGRQPFTGKDCGDAFDAIESGLAAMRKAQRLR